MANDEAQRRKASSQESVVSWLMVSWLMVDGWQTNDRDRASNENHPHLSPLPSRERRLPLIFHSSPSHSDPFDFAQDMP